MKKLFRILYKCIPCKNGMFHFLRLFKPGQKIYQHLHKKGKFKVKLENKKSFFMIAHGFIEENQLFWTGINKGWERKSLELWQKLCLDADVILDIGANTGLYSLVAKTLNPDAQVFAFEPLPGVVRYLNQNIEVNNFDVVVLPVAVSDYSGKANVFLREQDDFAYSVTVNKSLLGDDTPQKKLEISTVTLHQFVQEYSLTHISLMKIDVETHEPEVLSGFGNYLTEFRPDMIVEVWDKQCAVQLNEIFKGLDYLFFDIDDKNGTVSQKQSIEVSSFWNYLICKKETASKLGLI